jgi:3-methylfumaryl-CoA hydratase
MIAGGAQQRPAGLRIGRPAVRRSRLAGCRVVGARSGPLALVTVRHEFSQDGEVCLVERQDLAYRSGDGGQRPVRPNALPTDAEPVEPPGRWFSADPVLLFRFSALTGNSHRIHYDQAYATGVERYPGLVVHGPLLAIVMALAGRQAAGGRALAELSFRLSAPVFCGDRVHVSIGRPEADVVESVIRDAAGQVLASGRAVLG